MKTLFKLFLRGLLLITPIVITVLIVYKLGAVLDSMVSGLLTFINIPHYPGVGILFAIVIITLIGLLSKNWLSQKLFSLIDKVFTNVPLVKVIYTTIRDTLSTFTEGKKGFSQLALVHIPGSDIKLLGFITNEDMDGFGLNGYISVYLMQSMQWAGNLILVPKEMVTVLDMSVEDAVKFIASAGLVQKDNGN
ncbi:MAG: DUF502 domain-containing protein [Desulfitobacteriaceae bacterium]|nr:DUF502 domain-containing protein [Desulfitobacteriaceae bacterium]